MINETRSNLHAKALASAYAHRESIHRHLTNDRPYPYADAYGAMLIFRFSTLPPELHELVPDAAGTPAASVIESLHIAYVLGLGVLADEFNSAHASLPAAINTLAKAKADPQAMRAFDMVNRPTFKEAADLAVQSLMAQPTAPDGRALPRVALAYRQLDGVVSRLYSTVEQRQREHLGLESGGPGTIGRPVLALVSGPERR